RSLGRCSPLASIRSRDMTRPFAMDTTSTAEPPAGTTQTGRDNDPADALIGPVTQHPIHGCHRGSLDAVCAKARTGDRTISEAKPMNTQRERAVVRFISPSSVPHEDARGDGETRQVEPIEASKIPRQWRARPFIATFRGDGEALVE